MQSKLDPRTLALSRDIGERIERARLRAKLSKATVATRAGMTRTNYARIEYGTTNVTIDTLRRVADGIGLALQIKMVKRKRSKKA